MYFSKNCPEGSFCGTFLKKGQKCTLSKVGFDQKLRYILALSVGIPYKSTTEMFHLNAVKEVDNRVFAKVRFSKCTSLKIVPKAAFAVHF